MAELVDVKRKIAELETSGEIKKAISELEKAIKGFPNEGSLYNKLGDLYIKVNREKDALNIYEKGARVFQEETYFPNAIALCKKILRIDKNRTEIYGLLGELHKDLDQRGEAANYLLEYAERKMKANDMDAALNTYNTIKGLVPNNPKILKTISAIYEQMGKKDEGAELLEEAKEIESEKEKLRETILERKVEQEAKKPETPAATVEQLGEQIAEETHKDISLENFVSPEVAELLKEEELPPGEETIEFTELSAIDKTIELGELYLKLGSEEEAIECFRNAAKEAWQSKDYDKALNLNKRIADLRPFDLKSRQHLVEIARVKKDNDARIDFMLDLADTLNRRDAKTEAQKLYKEILKIDPENSSAKEKISLFERPKEFVDLGEVLKKESDFEQRSVAIHSIDELISEFRREVFESIGEGDHRSHYDLGVAYKGMGLYQEAIEEFDIAAKDENLKLKALEMTGSCFLERSKIDDAIRVLNDGLKIKNRPIREYFGIHFLLGTCYERKNDLKLALKSYVDAYNIDKNVSALTEKILQLKQKVTDVLKKKGRHVPTEGTQKKNPQSKDSQKPDRKSKITYL